MMSPTVHNAYSAAGAPTGHTSAQAPQSMHFSASITNLPSPSEIASTGQPSAQAPQEMHSSEILYAIILSSLYFFYIISPFGRLCNTFSEKFIFFILSKKTKGKSLIPLQVLLSVLRKVPRHRPLASAVCRREESLRLLLDILLSQHCPCQNGP